VRAVFSWVLRNLPAVEDRVFRLLGASPCRQLGADAAAALLGADPVEAGRLLDRLSQRHLVEVSAGRVGMHDLLRAYAAEEAAALRAAGRAAATGRLAGYFQRIAERAVAAAFPDEPPAAPDADATEPPAPRYPRAWLDLERSNLLAIAQADPANAGRLFRVLAGYLDVGAHCPDAGAARARLGGRGAPATGAPRRTR